MLTLRRELLDKLLAEAVPLMRGRVLDVGGRKENKRGGFRPPLDKVSAWEYLNPDPASKPDYQGTADAIPMAAGAVDTVVMTEVIEYLPDPGAALREIARVLKPGGACILTSPLVSPIHGDAEWDRQRLTRVRLAELAEQAGLRVESLREMGSLGSVLFDLLQASFGYASGFSKAPAGRLGRMLLPWTAPFFRWLDRATPRLASRINTGYFVVLRKS